MRYDYRPEGWQTDRIPQLEKGGDDVQRASKRTYNPDGTLLEETDRGGQKTQYAYDLDNNLTSAVDSSGLVDQGQVPVEISASWDSLGRPSKIKSRRPKASDTDWRVTSYDQYDGHGNVEDLVENRIEKANGDLVDAGRKLHYSYDQADQVDTFIDRGKDSASTATGDDRYIDVDFFPTGGIKNRVIAKDSAFADKLQTTAWDYFDNGLIKTLNTRNGANTLVESHTIDYLDGSTYLNGNPVKETFTLRGPKTSSPCRDTSCTTTWKYDARERLTDETRQRATEQANHYELDVAGNVAETHLNKAVTAKFEYTGNRLDVQKNADGDVVERYFYRDGNLRCVTEAQATKTDCDDYSSGTAFAGLLEFSAYDYQDRLLAQKRFDAEGKVQRDTSFDYDALDRPVKETERHGSAGNAVGSRTTEFAYLGLGASVTSEQQTPLSSQGKEREKSYSYDPMGERVALNDTIAASGSTPEKSRDFTYATDPHGSVSLLLNGTGQAQAAYGYTAYGETDENGPDGDQLTHEVDPDSSTQSDTPATDPLNGFRYTGKRQDTGTATLDMGARRFSPSTAHFLQSDFYDDALADLGLSTDELTSNRYSLAGGNPISFVESDGHEPASSYTDQRNANYYYSRTPAKTTGTAHSDSAGSGMRSSAQQQVSSSYGAATASRAKRDVVRRRAKDRNFGDHLANGVGAHLKGFLGDDFGLGRPESNTYKQRLSYWDNPAGDAVGFIGGGWRKPLAKGATRAGDEVVKAVGDDAAKAGDEAAGAGRTAARACSFSGATTVLMADGTQEPIEDVKVGDRVIATDPKTGERSARTVARVWVHSDRLATLTLDGERIATTEDHPFWNATDRAWQRADALDRGDAVLAADGKTVTVGDFGARQYRGTAYNLTVEGVHTYHVGRAAVLVHNSNGCGLLDRAAELRALAGRNRVSVDTPSGRLSVDLEGKAHFEKSLSRYVDTPHVKFETRHVGPGGQVSYRSGPVRAATHADLRLVAQALARRGG